MSLKTAADHFTRVTRSLSCMSVRCGTADRAAGALSGVTDEHGTPVREDSIFDLASLTKAFTAILLMRLTEQRLLDPDAPVTEYAPMFSGLEDLTVRQAAWFEKAVVTPERVDAQPDRETALRLLFEARTAENGPRPYSDMQAMVLKYVLEGASGLPYMALLSRELLTPLSMNGTFSRVPDQLRPKCVSCDREHRIENGRYILRDNVPPGKPHDPKAFVLYGDGEDCPGHAGLFSTAGDIEKLCRGILSGRVLTEESLREMARTCVGRPLPGGGYTQYLGCLCYVRHPDQHFSETPAFMSGSALGWSGFAGSHLAVDPEKGVFEFYLGSRVMDRLSVLRPLPGQTLRDFGLNGDGTGEVLWPDGSRVVSSVNYVYLKDAHLHSETEQVLRDMGAL